MQKIIQIKLFHIENTILILEMKKVEETTNMILIVVLISFYGRQNMLLTIWILTDNVVDVTHMKARFLSDGILTTDKENR